MRSERWQRKIIRKVKKRTEARIRKRRKLKKLRRNILGFLDDKLYFFSRLGSGFYPPTSLFVVKYYVYLTMGRCGRVIAVINISMWYNSICYKDFY
jgi:hypothetical protein